MRTVTHETVVFEKVRYTCDDCGKPLIEGEKPRVCSICEKEICGLCQWQAINPEEHEVLKLCRGCNDTAAPFLTQWKERVRYHEESVARLRALWKLASQDGSG